MTLDAREQAVYGSIPIELYKFFDKGSVWTYRYTSHANVVTCAAGMEGPGSTAHDYIPVGLTRSHISFTGEESQGELTVTVPTDCELAQKYLDRGPVTPVWLKLWRTFLGDIGAYDPAVLYWGAVSGVTLKDAALELRLRPLLDYLSRQIPRQRFQNGCNKVFGSAWCGVTPPETTVTLTAVYNGGFVLQADEFTGADEFKGGVLKRTADLGRWLVVQDPAIDPDTQLEITNCVRLLIPCVDAAIGQVFKATAGCNHTIVDCHDKWQTWDPEATYPKLSYGGFHLIPKRNSFEKGTR